MMCGGPTLRPGGILIELEGTISIRDLETQYGIELPTNAGFETLAGFLLFRLGYIPKAGETLECEGRRFTILEMEPTGSPGSKSENSQPRKASPSHERSRNDRAIVPGKLSECSQALLQRALEIVGGNRIAIHADIRGGPLKSCPRER